MSSGPEEEPVSVLQRFEKRLEGLVEGAFAKVFKGVVHPVEILNAMQREAEAHKAILAGGRTLVPNRYVIDLSPYDQVWLFGVARGQRPPLEESELRALAAAARDLADVNADTHPQRPGIHRVDTLVGDQHLARRRYRALRGVIAASRQLVGRMAAGYAELLPRPGTGQAALVLAGLAVLCLLAAVLVAQRTLRTPIVTGLRRG